MRVNVMLEPQEGLSYAEILHVARRAEALGFDGLFRSDHYLGTIAGPDAHSTDCWATLAGLAVQTERITLGSLVSPVGFRTPGNLAKVVMTVAEMAGPGRVVLGMGAGWMEAEHERYGFDFPDLKTRFARLEEQLRAVRGLGVERVVVGGQGTVRTPALAARYADELNVTGVDPAALRERRAVLDRACEEAGRDPGEVDLSVMTGLLVGEDESAVRRLHEELQDRLGTELPRERLAARWVFGTPDQAAERLGELADAGADAVMAQHLHHDADEMLDVLATIR